MWRNVVRNAAANVGGTFVGLVVGFVTMPLVVHHLGPVRFGLWALASGIVGYVGMLDLGLAPTLVRETATLLAHDDPAARRHVSETASTIKASVDAYWGVFAVAKSKKEKDVMKDMAKALSMTIAAPYDNI